MVVRPDLFRPYANCTPVINPLLEAGLIVRAGTRKTATTGSRNRTKRLRL